MFNYTRVTMVNYLQQLLIVTICYTFLITKYGKLSAKITQYNCVLHVSNADKSYSSSYVKEIYRSAKISSKCVQNLLSANRSITSEFPHDMSATDPAHPLVQPCDQ